jgi:hypothetical protein
MYDLLFRVSGEIEQFSKPMRRVTVQLLSLCETGEKCKEKGKAIPVTGPRGP